MVKEIYGRFASIYRSKVVSLDDIRKFIERWKYKGYDAEEVIRYMIRKKRAFKVLNDTYFIRGFGNYDFEYVPMEKILKSAFEKLGWKNWYLGLYSAWFNGRCAQQVYNGITVVNDRISRVRSIGGVKVYFYKTSRREMFEFGIEKDSWGIPYSDVEKTLLDFLYFSDYGGVTEMIVFEAIDSFFDDTNFYMIRRKRSYKKLKKYLLYYPDFVRANLQFYLKDWVYDLKPELKEVFA